VNRGSRGRPRERMLRSWFTVLDVRALRRRGRIATGQAELGPVGIVWLPNRLGGVRAFWICPACARRCEVLFWARRPGAPHEIGCRACQRVAYETTAMSPVDRLFAKRDAILARLGVRAPTPPASAMHLKPKGMRKATFRRELENARRFEALALAAGLTALTGRPYP
jgi:hypothetical protein